MVIKDKNIHSTEFELNMIETRAYAFPIKAVRKRRVNKGVTKNNPNEMMWVKIETTLSRIEVGKSVKYSLVCF